MRTPRSLVAALALVLLVTGCTIGGGTPPFLPGPKAEIRQEAAPAATRGDLTLRADEVRREGDTVVLGLTLGNAGSEATVYRHAVKVTTNSGVQLDIAESPNRTVPSNTTGAFSLAVPLPEASVTSLLVSINVRSAQPEITVPLPAADGAFLWRPAPLRQVGVAPKPVRTDRAEFVVDTVRSSGLVTEVEFHATGMGNQQASICSTASQCSLTEANGTVHPLLGEGVEKSPAGGRERGTLRFLGELAPDVTDLDLTVATSYAKLDPIRLTLPQHADSPAQPAAGSLIRPAAQSEPVTLKSAETGATLVIDRVDILADHIQVHVNATGGEQEFDLADGKGFDPASLTEPNGFEHLIVPPAEADLKVKAGAKMTATLVFAGSVPADVTSLTLQIGGWYTRDNPVTTTLTVPAAPAAEPPASATLAQVGTPPEPDPVLTASPAPPVPSDSPSPTEAAITAVDIQPLPTTSAAAFGPVRTSIQGVTRTGQTASAPDVDAKAEADAQRSLEGLGAQRTPDGTVVTLPEQILFDYNKADVKPDAAKSLDALVKVFTYYNEAKIGVQGHTDSTGDAAGNMDLSKRRAQAVADALQGRGVAAGRMTITGFGLSRPIAPNDTDENKAKNRRVEIVLSEGA